MNDQSTRGIEAPSTTEPAGAIQTKGHVPAIVFPTRLDLPTIITPRMFWSYCRSVPRRRLMSAPAAGEQQEREN
jgi:hypothetical protein